MRKVIYSLSMSLDGFIEGPNRDLDWQIIDEEFHQYVNDQEANVDTHLYGRRMYELMAKDWPTVDLDPANPQYMVEFARIWKEMPKIVFSKTLDKVEWNSRLVREVNPEEIMELKEQPGKDMELGGPDLAATFIRLGLIDEYRIFIQPIVLGRGTPMFPVLDDPLHLRLVETRPFGSGVVLLRYLYEKPSP